MDAMMLGWSCGVVHDEMMCVLAEEQREYARKTVEVYARRIVVEQKYLQ